MTTTEPRYSWNQAICVLCWVESNPGREPVAYGNPEPEQCSYCGRQTTDGIYIRDDPKMVVFPKLKED